MLASASTACVRGGDFHCSSDTECTLAGVQGRCELSTYCSFPDSKCASGSRFGEQSGAFGGTCVGAMDHDGGIDTSTGIDMGTDARTYAFSDQFSAGTSQWTVIAGTWAISAGAYRQTSNAYGTMAVAGSSWSNLTIEAKAVLHSGAEDLVRVMFRYVDSNNFAAGFFSNFYDVAGIEQVVGGTRTFQQSAFSTTVNQPYAMKVVVTGSTASISVDGTMVHTWTLPGGGPTSGKIGLASASDVSFDDVL